MRRSLTIALEGWRQLGRHPLRTFLTATTSAVAIAVTVNVISLVYGLDADLRRDTGRFGRRTVDVIRLPVIAPGMERAALGDKEVGAVRSALEGLQVDVVPRRLLSGRAAGDASLERVVVVAVPTDYPRTLDVPLTAGRWLSVSDPVDSTCVLDESAARVLFPTRPMDDVVSRRVEVVTPAGRHSRRVVGVLSDPITHRQLFEAFDEGRAARTLSSTLLSFRNLYVRESALGDGEYSGISVVAQRESDVQVVARRLRAVWPPGASKAPFVYRGVGIFVRREWMDLVGATSKTGAFLGNIVWIIIVGVAVVMLSTLHLLTIRERYDELAIRRVEGARRADVAMQVTAEGVATSLIGGVAGLPLGFAGAALLREIVQFPFRFELRYAVAATGVAVVLGLVAAVLPARRAAGLQPVRVLTRRLT